MAYATQSHGFASLGERALDLMGRIAAGMARRRAFHQTMRELEALSDRDLTDLGICRADIREVAQRAVYGRTSI